MESLLAFWAPRRGGSASKINRLRIGKQRKARNLAVRASLIPHCKKPPPRPIEGLAPSAKFEGYSR